MDLGTEAPHEASTRHSGQIRSQLLAPEIKAAAPRRSKITSKESDQPSIADYQRLVTLLQKRLQQAEAERLASAGRQKSLMKRCRIQRKLINHLRAQVGDQAQEISELERKFFLPSGKESHRIKERVVSLNGALQRISGVEVPADQNTDPTSVVMQADPPDAIDLEELQPIQEFDNQSLSDQMIVMLKQQVHRFASGLTFQFKRGVEAAGNVPVQSIISEGIDTMRGKVATLQGQGSVKAK